MPKTIMDCKTKESAHDLVDERIAEAMRVPTGIDINDMRRWMELRRQGAPAQTAQPATPALPSGEVSPQKMLPIRTQQV